MHADDTEDLTAQPAAMPAARLDRPVVLIGLMGAGKTSVGRILADRLDLGFVDADTEIEAAAGATIEEIFAEEGEAVFRSGERRVIARLLAGPPRVIATGGGAYMDGETRARIRQAGISIWLRAGLDILVKRVSRRSGRPLLRNGDIRGTLDRLMTERYPVYGDADIVVDTFDEPADAVAQRAIAALEDRLGVRPLALPGRPGRRQGRSHARHRRGTDTDRNR